MLEYHFQHYCFMNDKTYFVLEYLETRSSKAKTRKKYYRILISFTFNRYIGRLCIVLPICNKLTLFLNYQNLNL